MFKWICFILLINCLFFTYSANAYIVLTYKNTQLNFKKPTRILITGEGKEQGTQFQEVANSKALKYSELFPNEQIVLIAKNELSIGAKQSLLNRWGFVDQYEERDLLNGNSLTMELESFSKILSIDIFAHGTAQFGIYLDDNQNRFSTETKAIVKLIGHFEPDAYIIFHGCNTGFNLAPFLSSALGIPVAGALTSSDFQRLHSDGSFYLTQEKYYPNGIWAKENKSTFNQVTSCRAGGCIRLKPDNHPYFGYWGEYKAGGLPFYKFFCLKNSQKDCERIMAKSLYSFIGTTNLKLDSSLKEYKNLLGDFLCPISGTKDYRKVCREKLDLSSFTLDETFNPFRGPQIECDFKSCKVEFKCKQMHNTSLLNAKICLLINRAQNTSTTLVREYQSYLSGFKQLHEGRP